MSLLKKIAIYFFAIKVDGSDVSPGIYKKVFIETDSWVDVTSVNINSKKSLWRWKFRPTRLYTIFLRRIQRLRIYKIPPDVICIYYCSSRNVSTLQSNVFIRGDHCEDIIHIYIYPQRTIMTSFFSSFSFFIPLLRFWDISVSFICKLNMT